MDEDNKTEPDASGTPSWHPNAPEWAPPTAEAPLSSPASAPAPVVPSTQPMPGQPSHYAPPQQGTTQQEYSQHESRPYGGGQYGVGTAPAPMPTYRSWQPGIIALRPLSFGDFMSAPFKAMRFNRSVVLGGPLLFTLLATVLSVTALWLLVNDPQLGLTSVTAVGSGIEATTVIVGILAIVTTLLASVLSSVIVAPGVARAVLGERITLRTAWDQVRRKFGHILLLYVVTAVAIGVMVMLATLPLIFGIGSNETVWIVLGIVLMLIILGPATFVVAMITGLAQPIVVLEQIGAFAALGRAWRLVKGRFWWSVLIVFVSSALIYIATAMVQGGGQLIATLGLAVAPESGVVQFIAFFVIYGLAIVIALVVTYAYMGSLFTLLYTDMRMRHEGFDLDLARAAEARGRR
ncbi:hypothetical protein [Demequina aurantiaca]|uniref:hypothetical protein n=1 Tax=Demequina aurantiaca TaxID=676200 RepID=UPI0007815B5A|nr:hypothetical protein [Demequina aurantiaca]